MAYPLSFPTATIPDGESISDAVSIGDGLLVGLIVPSGWTDASITLQASPDDSDYFDVHDKAGTEVSFTVDEAQFIAIDPPMRGLGFVKLRSGASGSEVAQSGGVGVKVIVQKLRVP